MIAATGSGKGKTTFVTGLLNLLKDKSVHAFKCGPDYIDPMYHREILGIPSTNLDSYFCDDDLLKGVFNDNAGKINVIEAAMGLYDGIGATKRTCAYEIASKLNCPIILLIDGYGMGYSIVPLIKGFLQEDNNQLIKGLVINRISEKYYKKIAPVIENETGITVYGFIPKIKGAELKSRHLGLLSPIENNYSERVDLISNQIRETVRIEEVIEACKHNVDRNNETSNKKSRLLDGKVIGIAKDEAFSFYYEENIKFLRNEGAEIKFFSPIHDEHVPEDVDAIIFYGGYPENYPKEISDNKTMLNSIRVLPEKNVKIIAECGGFMYLLDFMKVQDDDYEMVSLIHGSSYRTKGLVRFGYVSITGNNYEAKGHEFHHYETKDVEYSSDYTVRNESSGDEYKGIICDGNILAGFPHLYYRNCPELIIDFIRGKYNE